MKHAYCIIAHQDPIMLRVMVATLDHPLNDIYIHIDKKVDITPFERVQTKWSKMVFLPERISIEWGGTSQIEAELLVFEYAFRHGSYSYYHMMSGQDLPLQSQDYIHNFFDNKFPGYEFVDVETEDGAHQKDVEYKTRYYHYFVKNLSDTQHSFSHYWHYYLHSLTIKIQKLIGVKRRYPFELKKSIHFVSISSEFVSYLLSRKEFIRKAFAHTLCADEIFLQTLLWDSPFREQLFIRKDNGPGSMRKVLWENGKARVWRKDDYEYLIAGPELFALKFTSQDKDLLLLLAEHNGCTDAVKAILHFS